MIRKFGPIFLGVIYFSALAVSSALAIETGGMGIAPANPDPAKPITRSWFMYEVDPGEVVEDAVLIQNTSDQPSAFVIEGLDAFLTEDGAFALTDSEETNEAMGTWIKLSQKRVVVPAKSTLTVPFTITVPAIAEVGDHVGGLTLAKDTLTPDYTTQAGGVSVGVSTRVAARMYLTVRGDVVRNLKVQQKRLLYMGGSLVTRFKVKNDGNIRANLRGETTVYSLFGVYDKQTVEIGTVLPKKTLTRDVPWPGKKGFVMGPYLARVVLTDTIEREGVAPMKPITVWMPAFFIPLAPTAIILLLVFLTWLTMRIRKWSMLANLARKPVVEHKVKAGESLHSLASNYGVGWKLLANLNNIEPPYHIEPGRVLYIPDAVHGTRRSDLKLPSFFGSILPKRKVGVLKSASQKTPKAASGPKLTTVIVEKGDTLKDVAEFAGITVKELARLNKIKDTKNHKLKAGSELIIPE